MGPQAALTAVPTCGLEWQLPGTPPMSLNDRIGRAKRSFIKMPIKGSFGPRVTVCDKGRWQQEARHRHRPPNAPASATYIKPYLSSSSFAASATQVITKSGLIIFAPFFIASRDPTWAPRN